MKDFIIRLVQWHETFRKAELEALATLARIKLDILDYSDDSPFCLVRLESDAAAKALIARSILAFAVYELWAAGLNYGQVHQQLKTTTTIPLDTYKHVSFRFEIDTFKGKRTTSVQRELIESFGYLPFDGPIVMNDADLRVVVFEEFKHKAPSPQRLFVGRLVGVSDRSSVAKYDLKKRNYISRTSMDAELSLVTANMTLAAPGKLIYDPFVGTGSFSVACAHFGAAAFGSDIDPRSIRGSGSKSLLSNFEQYEIVHYFLDSFAADLTHTPLRQAQMFDGIICDPPYGIREGPKVLGYRDANDRRMVIVNGKPAHLQEGYIAPKRPYGFDDMLDDILDFAVVMLVNGGRLSMWMPTANDEDIELAIPTHPGLKLRSVCVQAFNKWSRRLLTYERLLGAENATSVLRGRRERAVGKADDINNFRKKYFGGFKTPEESQAAIIAPSS